MNNSFLSIDEIKKIGLKSFGKNVFVSRYANFYSPETIEIGNNVRIDDFCILSGEIKLSNYIHISAYCSLYGRFGIEMEDYSGLSPRCTLFSATDDFNGDFLIGPMVDSNLINLISGKIIIKKFSQIGAGTIIMPNVTIDEGVAVGALSLVNKNLKSWTIYAGIPARALKKRSKNLLNLINNDTTYCRR